ncbi:dethiobiotin synthase [Texcoconibacillus texcoconensis]|uniref:ATP-dependent dethiobiotin synthetase BioD n=1 Tax=Texcoconibacillus texcoconensis TaxID=1095777 RepID=A0A840QM04_9BACI|nr:dethiobiotin synthase [Texcoconibacillus texcoconensis]MBB5172405.1 dethiobiotin synthetase [Texcoconibacillus texcoconensis]
MNHLFITGTDTEVGKTVVTSLLFKSFIDKGICVRPFKPIQTGAYKEGNTLIAPDVAFYQKIKMIAREKATHYLFEPACSPHLAGRMANTHIDIETIKKTYVELSQNYESILIEGAGGLAVPINESADMADLAKLLDVPIVIVSRPNLGTINHTLQTFYYAQSKGLEVAGVIFSKVSRQRTDIEEENIRFIEERMPVLGCIPDVKNIDEKLADENIALELTAHLNIDKLQNHL